ncbi:ATP synthase gamma chain 2 [Durusdinium trenchii]|uniref:F-ATPase gamma subunit n=1 Tax=Durusdinium trenchii TaxID=1381693 RepID=A0ABP0SEE7_9DINO
MLPLYLNSQLLSLLYDAQASELSSRMNAMKTATDNAKEIQKKLLLAYNKTKRQAAITAEICEISSAANAIAASDAKGEAGPSLGVMDNEESVAEDFAKELAGGDVPEMPVSYDQALDFETRQDLIELRRGRVLLRSTFEGEVLPWFDRWMEELAESAQQEPAREDECNSLACRLHAHQVLVLRNVPTSDFDSERIKRFLSSLTYLSSHHTFNQERLEVPETELFEALHLHRRFMVRWLVEQRRVNALQGFNSVLRSCHHQLSALGDTSADTSSFEWVCVGDASEYEGRFGVLSEAAPDKEAQGEAKEKEEASKPGIKTVNASDAFWIELNVQLLQVTVRGRTLVPLEDYIWNDEDFKHVFVSELGEKGAMQKTTVQCSALLTSSNATVRELLSIPFRATYWSSKPANFLPFLDEWDRLYDVEDLEEDEFWIAELFEPVRRQFFIPPPPRRPPLWFMKDEPIPGDTTVVQLMGVHQEAKARIWKEVHLFKERRMIHIYALRAYGHQLYRQLEYSSNARLCMRELQPSLDDRERPWELWARYEALVSLFSFTFSIFFGGTRHVMRFRL